jgi:4-oxalocrotonate tautomerase
VGHASQEYLEGIWRLNHSFLKVLTGDDVHIVAGVLALSEAKTEDPTMPLIEVHLIEKVFSSEQKRQIIQKLTDAMVSIEGENMRGVTWVKISEVTSGEWGIGGKPLTTEAVKELAAGRHAA